jgi:hypothetical protein
LDDFDWDQQGFDVQPAMQGFTGYGTQVDFPLQPFNGDNTASVQFPQQYEHQEFVQQPQPVMANYSNYGLLNDYPSNGLGGFNLYAFEALQSTGQPALPGYPTDGISQGLQLTAPFQHQSSFGWTTMQEQSMPGLWMQPDALAQPGIG